MSRHYRNRRIGEFLKELDLTEGRSTGLPKMFEKMARNGSPKPIFETDEDRTYFLIRLRCQALNCTLSYAFRHLVYKFSLSLDAPHILRLY